MSEATFEVRGEPASRTPLTDSATVLVRKERPMPEGELDSTRPQAPELTAGPATGPRLAAAGGRSFPAYHTFAPLTCAAVDSVMSSS